MTACEWVPRCSGGIGQVDHPEFVRRGLSGEEPPQIDGELPGDGHNGLLAGGGAAAGIGQHRHPLLQSVVVGLPAHHPPDHLHEHSPHSRVALLADAVSPVLAATAVFDALAPLTRTPFGLRFATSISPPALGSIPQTETGVAGDLPAVGETRPGATSGLIRLLVYLPDNTRLVWSGRVGDDGQINIYKTLDQARPEPSLIAGVLTFRDVIDISDLDGEFFWRRSANSRSPVLAEGFDFRQPVIASFYTPPARAEFALSSLIATSPNVELALTGNGADESFLCDWDDRNRIFYTPEDRELVRVNVNASSGLVTDFWFDRGNTSTRVNFRGALFQKQELGAGFWYFLDGQTGLMTLSPFDRPD